MNLIISIRGKIGSSRKSANRFRSRISRFIKEKSASETIRVDLRSMTHKHTSENHNPSLPSPSYFSLHNFLSPPPCFVQNKSRLKINLTKAHSISTPQLVDPFFCIRGKIDAKEGKKIRSCLDNRPLINIHLTRGAFSRSRSDRSNSFSRSGLTQLEYQ